MRRPGLNPTGLRIVLVVAIVVAALWAAPLVAEESLPARQLPARLTLDSLTATPGFHAGELRYDAFRPPRQVTLRPVASEPNRFIHGHLLPRLSQRMEQIEPYDPVLASQGGTQNTFYEAFSDSIGEMAGHAANRALRDYILEETPLARLVGKAEKKAAKHQNKGSISSSNGGFKLGVGGSLNRPQALMRYTSGAGSLKLRLGVFGSAGLEFQPRGFGQTRIAAGYDDRSGSYNLLCRFGF